MRHNSETGQYGCDSCRRQSHMESHAQGYFTDMMAWLNQGSATATWNKSTFLQMTQKRKGVLIGQFRDHSHKAKHFRDSIIEWLFMGCLSKLSACHMTGLDRSKPMIKFEVVDPSVVCSGDFEPTRLDRLFINHQTSSIIYLAHQCAVQISFKDVRVCQISDLFEEG